MNAFLLEDPFTRVLTEELIQKYQKKMNYHNVQPLYLKLKEELKPLFMQHANFRVSRKKRELIRVEENIIRTRLLGADLTNLENRRVEIQNEIICNDQLQSRVRWRLFRRKLMRILRVQN